MFEFFSQNAISAAYKRNKNLKETLIPLLFPRTTKQNECFIKKCNKKCYICKNVLVVTPGFTYFAAKPKYKIKGILKCGSRNVMYMIYCKCYDNQYVGFHWP